MALSPTDFAAALPALRPALLSRACSQGYQPADCEDLVCEATRLALLILREFKPAPIPDSTIPCPGLSNWLKRILSVVILRDRRRRAQSVPTLPIEHAALVHAPPAVTPREVIAGHIRALPESQRYLVCEWLNGESIKDIARDYGLNRNTVSNRLGAAFARMSASVPLVDWITFSVHDFDFCRRVIVYRKPPGSCGRWMRETPRDARIRLGNTERRPVLPRDALASRNIRQRRAA